mmetsp:Transcript_21019/g.29431  ORF Transcript_21019/g.29431 Transcript_21019/m.29431 type:complete len:228 (+) Transcript_21019:454-1137(+)|eukprot:CAMPEP_0184478766 /NCGR_PEP_ID=MMETSP0113_2-20130426/698_1 /TAXON_ID=91329 /ORGANISM="Norrisiella sphaerica, Strain BC52" /LENGTH=227 /DNA_ID=CAMNT_0026856663 /DNA_START=434 /DNA_END=1117 /DNA_ORIENTATION=+
MAAYSWCDWDQRRIDSTESYSTFSTVPQNIYTLYDEHGMDKSKIRFIMMIRDPMERAYSWFNLGKKANFSGFNVTFEEKVDEELNVINRCQNYAKSNGITDDVDVWAFCSTAFLGFDGTIVHPGSMARALKYYFRFFKPEQFLVLPMVEYQDNFTEAIKRISKHLGLKNSFKFEQTDIDLSRRPQELPALPQKLKNHFKSEYVEMAELMRKYPGTFHRLETIFPSKN